MEFDSSIEIVLEAEIAKTINVPSLTKQSVRMHNSKDNSNEKLCSTRVVIGWIIDAINVFHDICLFDIFSLIVILTKCCALWKFNSLTGPACNLNPDSADDEIGSSSLPVIGGLSISDLRLLLIRKARHYDYTYLVCNKFKLKLEHISLIVQRVIMLKSNMEDEYFISNLMWEIQQM